MVSPSFGENCFFPSTPHPLQTRCGRGGVGWGGMVGQSSSTASAGDLEAGLGSSQGNFGR